MARKVCGECEFHIPPWKSHLREDWTCNNEESDCYGLATEYNDSCEEFVERD